MVHWPNPHFDAEEALESFLQLRDEGLTRFIGVSNFPASLLRRAVAAAPELVINQVESTPS